MREVLAKGGKEMGGKVTPMGRTQALALACLALSDQSRQPDTLPEYREAEAIVRGILRGEDGDLARREDLSVLRSNFGLVDRNV